MSTTTAKSAKTDCGPGAPIIYNGHVVGSTAKFIVAEHCNRYQAFHFRLKTMMRVLKGFLKFFEGNCGRGLETFLQAVRGMAIFLDAIERLSICNIMLLIIKPLHIQMNNF